MRNFKYRSCRDSLQFHSSQIHRFSYNQSWGVKSSLEKKKSNETVIEAISVRELKEVLDDCSNAGRNTQA